MLQHLFPDYHYVSFDDRRERLQAREEPALFFMNHPAPVIIDEVQKEGDILEEIKLRAGWDALKAVANDQIFNADNDSITRPGPRLMDAVEALYEFISAPAQEEPAA